MESKDFILVDLIGDVVDSMRATGSIISSVETSGVYVIQSVNKLSNNESVKINSIDYLVSNTTSNEFTIEGSTGLDFTGLEWQALAPYYEFGHMLEIANTLSKKDNGVYSFRKYPLIILFQPYEGQKRVDESAVLNTISADLAIVNLTKPTYKSKQRYDVNIRPILYPLYDQLLAAIENSNYFKTSGIYPYVDHDPIEQPYWGSELSNSSNMMKDYLDGIELKNTELKILNGITNC